jgi:CheY-like chemotaxis protein
MKLVQRILIVEDDAPTASKYQRALQSVGDSRTAERVDQVFKQMLDFDPTLILLDVVLEGDKVYPPEEAGIRVLEEIRGLRSPFGEIPVIVVTALIDSETEDRCQKLGATKFLRKPVPLDTLRGAVKEAAQEPLRILFVAANPRGTPVLELDEEIRAIEQTLSSTLYRDRIKLVQAPAIRFSDLQTCLLRHKPHIVHFSGHGCNTGELLFKDDSGNISPVPPNTLSDLFAILKDNIQCVILSACYAEEQASAIARHIPCVIGMSRQIEDRSAIRFAKGFYEAIGYGRDLKTAFALGCAQAGYGDHAHADGVKLFDLRSNSADMFLVPEIWQQ